MKKIVLKVAIENESSKKKALKQVTGVYGVDSVSVDMKEKKMTVIGDVDPVHLTCKLRKLGFADLLSVGSAKEEKKEGEKKEEKKGAEKKEEKKPQGETKENKAEHPKVEVVYHVPMSYDYRPYQYTVVREEYPNVVYVPMSYDYRPYQYTVVREEYPNTCVIC
ncbi:hypothetical protein SUGI_0123870 [Cryptomeria japonica]|uniref:heavy metal-associated isoprenylated plant protein 39-like n=1 Tax=Cryptomeria japonica TaxID=3369 RepID=UPI002408CAAB|nr:heavy metal-associated isoprenylated plant protein 39-like [Cryptomeria japonica]GLJ10198.1 hypothetical protein SUGI_0123870 [Cryptomeria japonica]